MPEIASRIVAVTVFADRARVTRQGRTALEPGTHRVEFRHLPAALDSASLRVAVRGTVPTKLLGVDARKVFFAETPAARARDLEASLQGLQDEDREDSDRADTLTRQVAHLDGLGDATRIHAYGLANGKTTLAAQAELLAFLGREREAVQDRLRAVAFRRRDREKQVTRLQQELQQLRGERPRERYLVSVEVSAAGDVEVEVELAYILPGAGWRPLYDARLVGEELELTYLGEVQQSTGEDWAGVALTLSTARPAQAAAVPRLTPWALNLGILAPPLPAARPAPAAQTAWMTMAGSDVGAAMPRAAPPPLVAAEVEAARVEQAGASVTFQIPGRADVPGDGSPRKVTVGHSRLRPELDHVAVPKLTEAVYRRAKVANGTPYTLLPGRVQVFVGDDYLGAADLKMAAPGQTFELFFGADDRIAVERGLVRRDVSKTFLGGRRRLQYAYEIRLANHTGAAQSLTVVDQLPLPQHEDIKVSLDSADPRPTRQDELNTLIWKLRLEAEGRQRIRFEFTVEHPRDLPVAGLA